MVPELMSPQAPAQSRRDFSGAQLKLIRRSVARVCSDAEFDEFIAVASQSGLDPLRRQIAPLIVQPDDPERRRLIPWATIDGLRVIAARQGDYRPMETAPVIERDESRVDPERNPLGIVRAEVRAWKRSDCAWHPVAGEAWWDEYAPLREERATDERGQSSGTGRMLLEPSWMRMGRVLIAKCAEAQALRRGWPDVLSGLYGEEELHALKFAELTASERLKERLEANDQLRKSAGDALWVVIDPHAGLESIPRAELATRIAAFYRAAQSAAAIADFQRRNEQSLRVFWDWAPIEALGLKQLAETRAAELGAAASGARPTRRSRTRRAKARGQR